MYANVKSNLGKKDTISKSWNLFKDWTIVKRTFQLAFILLEKHEKKNFWFALHF